MPAHLPHGHASYTVYAVGWIQPDHTVKGGTGWGVELAKFFNREVSVFDQDREHWFTWRAGVWHEDEPTIPTAVRGNGHPQPDPGGTRRDPGTVRTLVGPAK